MRLGNYPTESSSRSEGGVLLGALAGHPRFHVRVPLCHHRAVLNQLLVVFVTDLRDGVGMRTLRRGTTSFTNISPVWGDMGFLSRRWKQKARWCQQQAFEERSPESRRHLSCSSGYYPRKRCSTTSGEGWSSVGVIPLAIHHFLICGSHFASTASMMPLWDAANQTPRHFPPAGSESPPCESVVTPHGKLTRQIQHDVSQPLEQLHQQVDAQCHTDWPSIHDPFGDRPHQFVMLLSSCFGRAGLRDWRSRW